ncbi:tRNA uridine-5-carboxymethylaminomethyl(34) synthesis GTPase MnmE [Alistipes sp.]|uniref:tRNA uridine-5-carboxymethylaminomethyl(34) synthesis GTPase MnmE n=1 Tax=Alistipes sp. TaxID=1872444 RepID=UPI0025C250D3|nr:tRNA uridine-5-carboxymethylaminomethyl(34) synthesis GTPase MnmE [Alistipes sp.]
MRPTPLPAACADAAHEADSAETLPAPAWSAPSAAIDADSPGEASGSGFAEASGRPAPPHGRPADDSAGTDTPTGPDATERTIDDVLATVFRAPHSYTGEDSVELSCHGSAYIVAEILRLLLAAGARMARPGEFTTRAFLAGKMDLAQAEAVADLIASSSRTAHALASAQMRGGYSSALRALRGRLVELMSLLELELDFSEEDVEFADRTELRETMRRIDAEIEALRNSFSLGNALKRGVAVAIVGAPNVGKSTLLNRLLGEERAMVSEIAGTTRDAIEETMDIDGVLFRFIDTAGIRATDDRLERMGIERTRAAVARARIVIRMTDAESMAGAASPSDTPSPLHSAFPQEPAAGQTTGPFREGMQDAGRRMAASDAPHAADRTAGTSSMTGTTNSALAAGAASAADAAETPDTTDARHAADKTDTTNSALAADAASAADAAETPDTTDARHAADKTDTTNSAFAAGAASIADATETPDTTDARHAADKTDTTNSTLAADAASIADAAETPDTTDAKHAAAPPDIADMLAAHATANRSSANRTGDSPAAPAGGRSDFSETDFPAAPSDRTSPVRTTPNRRIIDVVNKIDKAPRTALPAGTIAISAREGMGIDRLRQALRAAVDTDALYHGDPVVSSARHYEALTSAHTALGRALVGIDGSLPTDLLGEELRSVLYHLGTITGEITNDEILGTIFSKFCVGK